MTSASSLPENRDPIWIAGCSTGAVVHKKKPLVPNASSQKTKNQAYTTFRWSPRLSTTHQKYENNYNLSAMTS